MAELDDLEARLNQLVREFFEHKPDWLAMCDDDRGYGLCDEASEVFSSFCLGRGVDAVARWMSLSVPRFTSCNGQPAIRKPHPKYPIHDRGQVGEDHCVAVLEGRWVVDLTARQYGDEMPLPFLWELEATDQVLGTSFKEGDRVRATCQINMAARRGDEGTILRVFPGRRVGLVNFEGRRFENSAEATVLLTDEVEPVATAEVPQPSAPSLELLAPQPDRPRAGPCWDRAMGEFFHCPHLTGDGGHCTEPGRISADAGRRRLPCDLLEQLEKAEREKLLRSMHKFAAERAERGPPPSPEAA